VVGGEGWHVGVVGIVAARLVEAFHLPAIVLSVDGGPHGKIATGSARSIPGFDIHEALTACSNHLMSYGGHAAAAGMKLKAKNIEKFRKSLNDHAKKVFAGEGRRKTTRIDACVAPQEINLKMFNSMERLRPFGEGNPAPLFLMRSVRAVEAPRILKEKHLKLSVVAGGCQFSAIGFFQAHLAGMFESGPVDIVFRPMENNWRGVLKLELEIKGARPSDVIIEG
jgi:Single-stranded DNA-specific exonuclease